MTNLPPADLWRVPARSDEFTAIPKTLVRRIIAATRTLLRSRSWRVEPRTTPSELVLRDFPEANQGPRW